MAAAHTPGLDVTARRDGPVEILAARGELDVSTAPQLCLEVQRASARLARPRIVIDLRELEFSDSTGLRALICAAGEVRALAGVLAVVVTPASQVDRLLTLVGAREFLAVTGAADAVPALVGE
jgi:anti-anti-sigma factor